MTAQRVSDPPAKTVRLLHLALVTGVILFALISHFVLRQTMADSHEVSPNLLRILLALAVLACAASLLLQRRIPRRQRDDSADLFWRTALAPALIMWSAIEMASLLSVYLYALTGSQAAIGIASIAVVLFVIQNPARLERR
jgi:hypothetical protein